MVNVHSLITARPGRPRQQNQLQSRRDLLYERSLFSRPHLQFLTSLPSCGTLRMGLFPHGDCKNRPPPILTAIFFRSSSGDPGQGDIRDRQDSKDVIRTEARYLRLLRPFPTVRNSTFRKQTPEEGRTGRFSKKKAYVRYGFQTLSRCKICQQVTRTISFVAVEV